MSLKSRMQRTALALSATASLFLFCQCTDNKANPVTPETNIIVPVDTNQGVFNPPSKQPTAQEKTQAEALAKQSYDSLNAVISRTSDDPENLRNENIAVLREQFRQALLLDPTNAQANIGYSMTSILSIQGNVEVQKMYDSLSNDNSGSMTLGKLARASFVKGVTVNKEIVSKPTVPNFITFSYIQGVLDSAVMPVLNDAIAAVVRVESNPSFTYTFLVDGEKVKIDMAEIVLFEAVLRFMRASIGLSCAYNVDFYTSSTDRSYSWIDVMDTIQNFGYRNFTHLSNDTLYHGYLDDYTAKDIYEFKMIKGNFERPDFLTLRSPYHAQIKKDLQTIPALLRIALESTRNEAGITSYDLIQPTDFLGDMDKAFAEAESELLDEGVSVALCSKFRTPETFLTFVEQLLSGPYTFDETIDEIPFRLTINLTGFLQTPVQDLRTLLPKFRWLDESMWKTMDSNRTNYINPYKPDSQGFFYCNYYNDTLVMEPGAAVAVYTSGNCVRYSVKQPIHYEIWIDSSYYVQPVTLIRDNGTAFDVDNDNEFPYFNDYTFAGTFPEMTTRQKWVDFINQWEANPADKLK